MLLPSQVVEHFIEKANYHWIMNTCLCRDASKCKDYPVTLGCLFLGEAALGINPKLGRRGRRRAHDHVKRCREARLVHLIGCNKLDRIWLVRVISFLPSATDPSLSREQWALNWEAIKERGSIEFETVHRTKGGEIFPVGVRANYVRHEDSEYNCVFARDITERKQMEASLRLTQLSVDGAADLIHWIAPDGRLLYVSDSNCRRHGYSREELLGMTIFDLDPVLTRRIWEQQWQEMQERGSFSFETVHRTKAGEVFPVEVVVNYVRHGQAEYNFAFARDISRRKKAEQALHKAKATLEVQNRELERTSRRLQETNRELAKAQDALTLQARTDSLTGCLNHGAVLSRLDEELERARRGRSSLAVGMVDIDRFKKINDTYGHLAGDRVLCEVVARSLGALRPYDVFGRFGGEEFLVVISAAEDDEARSVLERILAAIAQEPVLVEGRNIPVSVSIGGALWSKESSTDFIRLADQALYRAKAQGRNRLVMHGSGPSSTRVLDSPLIKKRQSVDKPQRVAYFT